MLVTAKARKPPDLICGSVSKHGADGALNLSAERIADRRRPAAVCHKDNVGAGHHLEQLAGDVLRRAERRCADVDLSGTRLGVGQ